MRIQHNIMAMSAYRNYTNNVSAMKKNLEKLSSGYKINRAGDDAAGLAISEKMRAQITGLETAQKNAKDGISLVQTAEGALTEVHDMLNRMVELASQSANGTYSDDVDREQLQKELEQLTTEIDRISKASNFNGIALLDGSMSAGGGGTSVEGIDRIISAVLGAGEDPVKYTGDKTILDGGGNSTQPTKFDVDFTGLTAKSADGAGGGTPAVAAVYKSADQTLATTGGTAGTPGKLTTAALAAASTTAGANDSFTVTIGGKAYDVDDANTTVKDQADAWCAAYNADAANTGWTAAADGTGAITITGSNDSTKTQTDTGVTGGTWTPGDDGTQNATLTLNAEAAASTTAASSKVSVTIGGKAYEVDKTNTTVAQQVQAWVDAYNADTAVNDKYTAAVGTGDTVEISQQTATADATTPADIGGVTGTWAAGTAGTPGTPGGNMTIAGHTVAVTANDLAGQLQEFVTDWNTNGASKDIWTASVDGNAIKFTAKTAGAIDGDGPAADAVTALTEVTAGADEVPGNGGGAAGDIEVSFKLGGADIVLLDEDGNDATSVKVNANDTATAIATAIFGALKDEDAAADGTQVTINGAKWNVTDGGDGKLTFELADDPNAKNIQGNFDWDVSITGGKFEGNHTAGTVVTQQGQVGAANATANTVFKMEAGDIVDGTKITIDGTTVTLAVGAKSTQDTTKTGVIDLTDMEAGSVDLNKALGKISEGFKDGTTNFIVGVNDTSNNDAQKGLTVHKKDGSNETYDTKEKLAAVFSMTTPGTGKALTLQIGDTADGYNQLKVDIKACDSKSIGLDGIDISTQDGATDAITKIKDAINYVSDVRGGLGATQNRLDHTINNLSVMTENIQDAESTIRDVDVAEEMMAYTKNNILIQSAQAMLAQANQVPQGVLQLLQ